MLDRELVTNLCQTLAGVTVAGAVSTGMMAAGGPPPGLLEGILGGTAAFTIFRGNKKQQCQRILTKVTNRVEKEYENMIAVEFRGKEGLAKADLDYAVSELNRIAKQLIPPHEELISISVEVNLTRDRIIEFFLMRAENLSPAFRKTNVVGRHVFSTIIGGTYDLLRETDQFAQKIRTYVDEAILDGIDEIRSRLCTLPDEVAAKVVEAISDTSRDRTNETDSSKRPKPSAELKRKMKSARKASQNHKMSSAFRLWNLVRKQAEKEGNQVEKANAQVEAALALAQDAQDPKEALKLADECFRSATGPGLEDIRSRLLQVLGEIHRVMGNNEQARGFTTQALEHARRTGAKEYEGFALLSLAAFENSTNSAENNGAVLEIVEQAYNAFTALFASGDMEEQDSARIGFAQCHCLRAMILGQLCVDDALAEWTRAWKIFDSMGQDWLWNRADALLQRARQYRRGGEYESAVADLQNAGELFQQIDNTEGLARCALMAGELLDSIGEKVAATEQYEIAVTIAEALKNEQKASYYHFRYACKLTELGKYKDAKRIFTLLANAEKIDPEFKLTVTSQLCMIANVEKNKEILEEQCASALDLIDELLSDSSSGEIRRSLLIRKGTFLGDLGLNDQAIEVFNKAIKRFTEANDSKGVIECWFQISGLMQKIGDRKREHEALEKVLDLGGEKLTPVFASLALVGLAQLYIHDQRFAKATKQLDRAEEIDPKNPAVKMMAADLRSKLPQDVAERQTGEEIFDPPPQRSLKSLIQVLRNWCELYPKKRNAIVPLWYYLHQKELWNNLNSMLGVKLLICTPSAAQFSKLEKNLQEYGDYFVWGTNFGLKRKRKIEIIKTPRDFLHPSGATLVFAKPKGGSQNKTIAQQNLTPGDSPILKPIGDHPNKRYYLSLVKGLDDSLEPRSVYAGETCRLDSKVVKFMLALSGDDKHICLPLTENKAIPNLNRCLVVALENNAIPVFSENMPDGKNVTSICDTAFDLPVSFDVESNSVKAIWANFLFSCSQNPRASLTEFSAGLTVLSNIKAEDRFSVRVFILRFQAGEQEAILPAMIVDAK